MPKISCIMTTYNSEKYLEMAIESILNQTFDDFEFIISEWWSTDNTKGILKKYAEKDKRIIFIDNEKNLSNCDCLNQCLKIARWDFIAIMESDDFSSPDRFEFCYECFKKQKDMEVLYPMHAYFYSNNEVKNFNYSNNDENQLYKKKISGQQWLLWEVWWLTVSSFFQRNIIKKIWYFEYRYFRDTHFAWKVYLSWINYYNVKKITYLKREDKNSLWNRKKIQVWIDRYKASKSLVKKNKVSLKTILIVFVRLYWDLILKIYEAIVYFFKNRKILH